MSTSMPPLNQWPLFKQPDFKPDLSAARLDALLAQSSLDQPLTWADLVPLIKLAGDAPHFPKTALDYITQHWAHYRADAHQELMQFASNPALPLPDDYCLHIFSACLLAQQRDDNSFDIVQKLALLSTEALDEELGDAGSEILAGCFAAWCHQSPDRIQWLREMSIGMHGQSWLMRYVCSTALTICAGEGMISFDQFASDATAFCEHMITQMKLDIWIDPANETDIFSADTYVSFAVCNWMDVYLTQAHLPLVKSWFEAGYVDTTTVRLADIEDFVNIDEPLRLKGDPNLPAYPSSTRKHFPKTVLEEIGWWSWFREGTAPSSSKHIPWDDADPRGDFYRQHGETVPFVRSETKVGRNEPCTCGSGKKYKKCCGA